MRPENLKEDDSGEVQPNPNWYQGTGWRFTADERGRYRLSLRCETGEGAKIELTDAQAAKLLYMAQAGELDDYGHDRRPKD